MSEQQKQLYVAQNIVGNNNLYTLSFTMKFEGNLDCSCLYKSIQKVFDHNEILKSRIVDCGDVTKLTVDCCDVKIEYIENATADISDYTAAENINLKSDTLSKIKLIKIKNDSYILYFSFHHILIDGDSIKLFCDSLRKAYNEELNTIKEIGKKPQLTQNKSLSYFDYVFYQDIFRKSSFYRQQKNYFQNQFIDQYNFLSFPSKETEIHNLFDSDDESILFDLNTFIEMQKYALANKIHINSLFLSGLALLLSSYCNTDDIVIGCISNGRENNILFKNIIGFFSNIMTLRLKLKPEMNLKDFISYVNEKLEEGLINQDYSYGEIVRDMNAYGNRSSKSLIQVIFNMQKSYDIKNEWDGINKVSFNLNKNDKIIYDLIIDIKYSNDEVIIKIEYSNEVFSSSLIKRFIKNYQYVLENTLINLNCPLVGVSCVNSTEQELILKSFNNTDEDIQYKNIHDIFFESMNSSLDKLAIVDEDMQLTYSEIKRHINSFASVLSNNKTEKEIIAILLDRSALYVISLLSVLSVNAAFVPIDPSIPVENKISILKDCSVKRIITSRAYIAVAENLKNKVEEISIVYVDNIDINEADYKLPIITPKDLAYVMFTSGTTGTPKGAMVNHENLVNLFLLFKKFFNINNENKIIQFSNISFDASIWEIFMALYHGATLYIPPKAVILNTHDFSKYIDTYQIDTMTLPPVYARQLENLKINSMKNFIVAGSVSYNEDYSQWKDNVNLYNAYGLTETTICATVYNANDRICKTYKNELPVGKPAPNTKLFILDKWNRIAPMGVTGELYISGKCLSKGYVNNKSLTEEKFLSNKYFDNNKMYRTGDLALWLEDGNIIITGRNDEQIKIKGIRIELPAIESVYLRHEKISQFAVVASKRNNDYVIKAFYTADDKLDEDNLRSYGNKKLPGYMIPHQFIRLEKLPISNSGKIDKRHLLSIDTTPKYIERKNVDDKISESITDKIYTIVSGLTEYDIDFDDNFFEIGLDSYLLILLINKIQEVFNVEIRTVELFKYTTINSLSKYLGNLL
jgi:amino acid adenylation domain-containing protein